MNPEGYESFVVRCWLAPADAEQPGRWHGEVEHIQSGSRWAFSTLSTLLAFLQAAVTAPNATVQSNPDEPLAGC